LSADPRFAATAAQEPPKHEKPIEGWKAIANELDVSVETVQRMARRNRDPLPVWKFIRTIVAWRSAIQDWKSRNLLPLTTTDQLEALEGKVATAIPPADDI
jgi:hypothetical protein